MTTGIDPALADYASRLLVGTDHTPITLLTTAQGTTPAPGAAAAAVRDGWDAARTTTSALTAEGNRP